MTGIKHPVNSDFISICEEIVAKDLSLADWAAIESDDMFEKGDYSGGFDATEMEFCFSCFSMGKEFWFQVSLPRIKALAEARQGHVVVREART